MKRPETLTAPEETPLPLYERMSYLIYAGALLALFCIVHEPEAGVNSMGVARSSQIQALEPSRDFPPQRHQPASARSPLTTHDTLIPTSVLSQLKQYARQRQSGID